MINLPSHTKQQIQDNKAKQLKSVPIITMIQRGGHNAMHDMIMMMIQELFHHKRHRGGDAKCNEAILFASNKQTIRSVHWDYVQSTLSYSLTYTSINLISHMLVTKVKQISSQSLL